MSSEDLKIWRIRERLNTAQAAAKLGITTKTLYRWEHGRYPRDLRERVEAITPAAPVPAKPLSDAAKRREAKEAEKAAKQAIMDRQNAAHAYVKAAEEKRKAEHRAWSDRMIAERKTSGVIDNGQLIAVDDDGRQKSMGYMGHERPLYLDWSAFEPWEVFNARLDADLREKFAIVRVRCSDTYKGKPCIRTCYEPVESIEGEDHA